MARAKATDTRGELESRHRDAAAELRKLEGELATAQETCEEANRDLASKQRWLAAASGQAPKLAAKYSHSSEWPPDLAKLSAEITALHGKIKEALATVRELEGRTEAARQAEHEAFVSLHRFNHREGAIESLRLEVASYHARRKAHLASRAVAERAGVLVGSLPVCWRVDANCDITDATSGIAHRIRELETLGYINPDEIEWLAGVNWRI